MWRNYPAKAEAFDQYNDNTSTKPSSSDTFLELGGLKSAQYDQVEEGSRDNSESISTAAIKTFYQKGDSFAVTPSNSVTFVPVGGERLLLNEAKQPGNSMDKR